MSKCNCKKDKCLSPAVLQINNPDCPTVFHKVTFPAAMGDDETNPPRNGQYRNVLLVYEANGHVYMFSSDGIPTLISDGSRGIDDYNELTNKPSIEGHELVGDSSLEDIGVTDAIEDALEDYTPTSEFAEVAFTGDYDDLIGTPTIPVVNDATLTITRNGTSAGTFTANSADSTTIDISVPTATSDLNNDSGFITNTVNDLANYYTKNESDATFVPQTRTVNNKALSSNITLTASDVGALPDSTVIPTVNDATLTIQKEGSSIGTFTANSATSTTVNVVETDPTVPSWAKQSTKPTYSYSEITDKPTIPTKTSDLTNDGASGSSTYVEASELGNYVTLGTNQNITGEKTFVGNKRIKFKGTASNSKLGFTSYDQNNGETGFLEVEGASTASKKVRLGCYDQNSGGSARDNYVGFQYYNTKPVGGGTISYNLVCPPQYKGLSGANSFAYIPIDFTDGNTTIRAGVDGVLNLSSLLPSSVTVVQTTGQSTTDVMSQKAVTDIIGDIETVLQTLNNGGGAQ